MSYTGNDDPTIPPPGQRSGKGADSVVPYLVKTLAAKPKAQASERDETRPGRSAARVRGFDRDDENPDSIDYEL